MVLTAPLARLTRRTLCPAGPEKSPVTSTPEGCQATPTGKEKRALEPVPSRQPAAPTGDPASVVTRPPGVHARMRWLAWSAMYMVPSRPSMSMSQPVPPNLAALPHPSAKPAAPPARVVSAPAGVATRSRPMPAWESKTYTLPVAAAQARPLGEPSSAPAPRPSAYPATPDPTSVLTTAPASATRRTRPGVSPTYATPRASSMQGEVGAPKAAAVPVPSTCPATPLPASVATAGPPAL
jgi:hypothetical protein